MTIEKIHPNGTDYLFQHSTHEYFSEQENEKGYLNGRLTTWQGLEGKEATKQQYDRFMSFGSEEFKGVELDFSPPKDFSILLNRATPEEREKLMEVWHKALDKVTLSIEQNTYYRETKNGKTEHKLAKGSAMAVFTHHTARPVAGEVDLQLHAHCVVFPKVLGQDGKFHSHTLTDLKYEKNNHETLRYIDSVGQYELAKGLNELGYSVSPDKNNNLTIDGISIKDEFSKRTNQINSLAGQGADYAKKKEVSLKIRENKVSSNLSQLREKWQSKMDSLGLTSTAQLKSKQKNLDKSFPELQKDLDKNIFSNKEIKTMALQQATFSNKTFEEKFSEFKNDIKLEKVTSKHNIYKSNYAMTKLAKGIKSHQLKKSLAKEAPAVKAPAVKPIKLNQSITDTQQQQPGAPAAPQGSSSGESVHECLSEIKNLENQLSSLKLDDPKRSNLESKIGDLKERIKSIESSDKENLSAKATVKENEGQVKNPDDEQEEDKEEDKNRKKPESKTPDEILEEMNQVLDGRSPLNKELNELTKQYQSAQIKENIEQAQEVQQVQQAEIAPSQ